MTAMRTRKNTTAIATPFNTTNRCERGYFNASKNHLEEKEPLGNVREQDMSAIWCEGDPDNTYSQVRMTHLWFTNGVDSSEMRRKLAK